jgi:hypothetical protein
MSYGFRLALQNATSKQFLYATGIPILGKAIAAGQTGGTLDPTEKTKPSTGIQKKEYSLGAVDLFLVNIGSGSVTRNRSNGGVVIMNV